MEETVLESMHQNQATMRSVDLEIPRMRACGVVKMAQSRWKAYDATSRPRACWPELRRAPALFSIGRFHRRLMPTARECR
mmetsp:Transcript_74670/g.207590  ORF Transcript_74670/g.207590 Transcript_74670/m.207590 type:complete len:80 (+) Transcript_74670:216-455(+)